MQNRKHVLSFCLQKNIWWGSNNFVEAIASKYGVKIALHHNIIRLSSKVMVKKKSITARYEAIFMYF